MVREAGEEKTIVRLGREEGQFLSEVWRVQVSQKSFPGDLAHYCFSGKWWMDLVVLPRQGKGQLQIPLYALCSTERKKFAPATCKWSFGDVDLWLRNA